MTGSTYCQIQPAETPLAPLRVGVPGVRTADCVLCGEPSEWPADTPGAVHCPRCAWQQAQRGACSG